jgi:hypothetical protein
MAARPACQSPPSQSSCIALSSWWQPAGPPPPAIATPASRQPPAGASTHCYGLPMGGGSATCCSARADDGESGEARKLPRRRRRDAAAEAQEKRLKARGSAAAREALQRSPVFGGVEGPSESPCSSPSSPPPPSSLSSSSPARTQMEDRALIVLDWDDTLLPTTWLNAELWGSRHSSGGASERGTCGSVLGMGAAQPPPSPSLAGCDGTGGTIQLGVEAQDMLQRCEAAALTLLEVCCAHGRVVIVTNSQSNWVGWSAQHYMPRLAAQLKMSGVAVLSAQSTFRTSPSSSSPRSEEVTSWKRQAYVALLTEFTQQRQRPRHHGTERIGSDAGLGCNLVSIGDSEWERAAALFCGAELSPTSRVHSGGGGKLTVGVVEMVKTVKLLSCPSVKVLRQQLLQLVPQVAGIVNATEDVNVDWDAHAGKWEVVEAAASFG